MKYEERNFFQKIIKRFFIVCYALLAISYTLSAAYADDDQDPFVMDAALGADAALPDATIVDSGPLDMNATPVVLNQGASFVAVHNFDIAGVYLGMSFEDVETLFFKEKSLYTPRKQNSIIYTVASDWKYNLDYECRQRKIIIPSDLEKCILSAARKRGLLYPSELNLERLETGERIQIFFTSNATDNVVWRVIYSNDVNVLEGGSEKFANQRDKKIMAWWQEVLDKYGLPNSGNDKWVSSDNSFDPMMTAFYGKLDLTDQGLMASDAAKNVTDARENFRAKPYSF